MRHDRRHHDRREAHHPSRSAAVGRRPRRQGASPRPRRKGGTQSQAINGKAVDPCPQGTAIIGSPRGKSKGGWTTKILALTDALGNLVRFVLLPGQRHDTVGVAPLIQGSEFGALIADTAFASSWIIDNLTERGAGIIIRQRP